MKCFCYVVQIKLTIFIRCLNRISDKENRFESIQLCCSLEFIYDCLMKSQFLLEETKESRLNFFIVDSFSFFLLLFFNDNASSWNESFFFFENKKMVPVESHLER